MDFLRAELKSVDEKSGTWTAVASAAVVDRDNERVMPRCLSWRTPTVPVHIDHDLSIKSLVGRCKPYYDHTGTLLVDGKWGTSELAQSTRRAVMDGSLDAMSIVFIDAVRAKGGDGIMEIQGGELIATDWVTIPSCTASRVLAARGYGGLTVADARRYAMRALVELVELDLAEARAVADRGGPYKSAAPTNPGDVRSVLAEAKQLLADLAAPPGARPKPPEAKAVAPDRLPTSLFDVWNRQREDR
jgi:hypothetical protein